MRERETRYPVNRVVEVDRKNTKSITRLENASFGGARIALKGQDIDVGDRVILCSGRFLHTGVIKWVRDSSAGLAFDHPLTHSALNDLAGLLLSMEARSARDRTRTWVMETDRG